MTSPDELTPETLRAVFHALWHSRMLVPGPTEEDCLAHVSAWAADRRDAALEKRDKLQRAEESVVLRARIEALESKLGSAMQALVQAGLREQVAELDRKHIEELERELAKLQPPSTLDRMIDEGHIDDSPNDY